MRKEPKLSKAYQKDPQEEAFLERFNAVLAPFQEEDYQDLPETYPTLHVIGVPRSGTTLLTQLVAAHLDLGYINNLIAAFWRTPVYGIQLSKKLLTRIPGSTFQSDFGRTADICGLHEFGRFWSELLGYSEMLQQDDEFERLVDWDRLRLLLNNMTHAFNRPMVFKSFLLAWHIAKVQGVMQKACFVRIRRDPVQNAMSLLKARRSYLESAEQWVGLKPREYHRLKNDPLWRQVVGQVYYVEKSITQQIEQVRSHNVLEVAYEDLCRSPCQVLTRIRELLKRNGSNVSLRSEPPAAFAISTTSDCPGKDYQLICEAVQELYGTLPT